MAVLCRSEPPRQILGDIEGYVPFEGELDSSGAFVAASLRSSRRCFGSVRKGARNARNRRSFGCGRRYARIRWELPIAENTNGGYYTLSCRFDRPSLSSTA
ncbi:hypothetical protein R1flu_024399 [Riccia fluitans]|uniref:Uncharacterized protein n=1 Tax=Riccia fluitans TaxID=41844 RepID=A0ABD1XUT1_9MARC